MMDPERDLLRRFGAAPLPMGPVERLSYTGSIRAALIRRLGREHPQIGEFDAAAPELTDDALRSIAEAQQITVFVERT